MTALPPKTYPSLVGKTLPEALELIKPDTWVYLGSKDGGGWYYIAKQSDIMPILFDIENQLFTTNNSKKICGIPFLERKVTEAFLHREPPKGIALLIEGAETGRAWFYEEFKAAMEERIADEGKKKRKSARNNSKAT